MSDPLPEYEALFTRNIGFVDENEQALLKHAHIAVLGVGGMGGVAAQVLARAGVGRLTILDKDVFEPSNTNRQVFARVDTWGRSKVEVTAEELRRIQPLLDVRVFDHWGDDVVDAALDGVHVVINGMDELGACLRLWRACAARGIPYADAYTAPIPNVFTVRRGEPSPEEWLRYPTQGTAPDQVTPEQAGQCKAREAIHVALHTASLKEIDLQVVQEILSGQRARISFSPMVWMAGVLLAWEAVKLRLERGDRAPYRGRFWNVWRGEVSDARGFLPGELELAVAAFQRLV